MFDVRFAELHAHVSGGAELLRLRNVEFVITAFTLLLQDHELAVSSRDRSLKFGARAVEVLLGGGNGLALFVELRLYFFPTRIITVRAVRSNLLARVSRFGL